MNTQNIQASAAMYPGFRHARAVALCHEAGSRESYGQVQTSHLQLVPQCAGAVDDALIGSLQALYPDTQFRLHANVRSKLGFNKYDASSPLSQSGDYFDELARLSGLLDAPAYTLHAGRREFASLKQMKANVLAIQDKFNCPVGVEGLYPTKGRNANTWLIQDWEEYRWLMHSGLYYALDLSHLNIVRAMTGKFDRGLFHDLLAHPNCLEIHVSGNDGHKDSHATVTGNEWWWEYLEDYYNPQAVIFSEGRLDKVRNLSRRRTEHETTDYCHRALQRVA